MKNRTKLIRAIPALLAALALLAVPAATSAAPAARDRAPEDSGGGGPTITVGSKNFTEQYILGSMYAQALEANGFNVEKKLDLGSEQIADKALQNGQIDLYPEYTGTALVAIVPLRGTRLPDTPEATYQEAREGLRRSQPGRHDARAGTVQQHLRHLRPQVGRRGVQPADPRLTSPRPPVTSRLSLTPSSRTARTAIPNMQKNYPASGLRGDQDRQRARPPLLRA